VCLRSARFTGERRISLSSKKTQKEGIFFVEFLEQKKEVMNKRVRSKRQNMCQLCRIPVAKRAIEEEREENFYF